MITKPKPIEDLELGRYVYGFSYMRKPLHGWRVHGFYGSEDQGYETLGDFETEAEANDYVKQLEEVRS